MEKVFYSEFGKPIAKTDKGKIYSLGLTIAT
jgi:hypothetical protein